LSSTITSDDQPMAHSLLHLSLPTARSVRFHIPSQSSSSQVSAISELSIMSLKQIDRITKFGVLSPTNDRLDDETILQQPIVRNLDNGKYMPFSDANPITQTILERVHGSNGNLMSSRRNSVLKNHHLRRNSVDQHLQLTSDVDLPLARSKRRSTSHDGEEHNSFSSESSSTKSSHTTGFSSSSTTSKSSNKTKNLATSLFQDGKKHLARLVTKNFLRKSNSKKNSMGVDLDDDEDDGERVLINDGSNGDLKYKASRYLKEQSQFDRTQLLQTIVNAHEGPIWCMR
jgi:hypothetical protein